MADTLRFQTAIADVYDDITDSFTRTESGGWGTADTGQTWGTADAQLSVSGGVARMSLAAVDDFVGNNLEQDVTDLDLYVDVDPPIPGGGSSTAGYLLVSARDSADGFIVFYLWLNPNDSGPEIAISDEPDDWASNYQGEVSVEGAAHGDPITLRCQVIGGVARMKAWLTAGSEPEAWMVGLTVNLTEPGEITLGMFIPADWTNTPPILATFDNLSVSSPATVTLDLNDDATWGLNHEGTDFSPPALRHAASMSMLADGAHYAASAYDDRVIRLNLDLIGDTIDDAATELQKLARELDKPSNILMWQPGTTEPVYFRTIRSSLGRIVEVPGTGRYRSFVVDVLAEPFAYGRVETLAAETLSGDPLDLADGVYIDIGASDVKGDVHAPLVVTVHGAVTAFRDIMFATRRGGDPTAAPFLSLPVDYDTLGDDTTLNVDVIEIDFATAPDADDRFNFYAVPLENPDVRGRYRLFGRFTSDGATEFEVFLDSGDGASDAGPFVEVPFDAAFPTSVFDTDWIFDFGMGQLPNSQDPITDGATGVELPAGLPVLTFGVGQLSGTGTLTVHWFALVPADDQVAFVRFPNELDGAFVWDGVAEAWYRLSASGAVTALDNVSMSGASALYVNPGEAQRLYVMCVEEGSPDDMGENIVSLRYQPRYLYVRPPTT